MGECFMGGAPAKISGGAFVASGTLSMNQFPWQYLLDSTKNYLIVNEHIQSSGSSVNYAVSFVSKGVMVFNTREGYWTTPYMSDNYYCISRTLDPGGYWRYWVAEIKL